MSFLGNLFKRNSIAPEERRERLDANDAERVSCMDVVRTIKAKVAGFSGAAGMVVVLLEWRTVRIFLFDGIARVTWGYNNQVFSTDRIGQTYLVGPPITLALSVGSEPLLSRILQREFHGCEITVGKLWKFDPNAADYVMMELLHRDDVGVRISFDNLSARNRT